MQSVTTMPDAHRRLLNVLYDHGRQRPTVKTALGDADASVEDARTLAKAELIRADNDDVQIPPARIQDTTEAWLGLTPAGIRWVEAGENLFLRVLRAACQQEGKLNLAKAIKAGGNDRVLAAIDAGYATAVWDHNLRELPPSRSVRAVVTGPNPGHYALVRTPKIHQVLGQR